MSALSEVAENINKKLEQFERILESLQFNAGKASTAVPTAQPAPACHKTLETLIRGSEDKIITQTEDLNVALTLITIATILMAAWLLYQAFLKEFSMFFRNLKVILSSEKLQEVFKAASYIIEHPYAPLFPTAPTVATGSNTAAASEATPAPQI